VGALTFLSNGDVDCFIGKTKTSRREGVTLQYRMRPGPCAARALRRYTTELGLRDRPEASLYPGTLQSAFREVVKEQVRNVGLDPPFFSGHSFRAGHASDLFDAQVPLYVIKTVGRWRSDTVLRYYRDPDGAHRAAQQAAARLYHSWIGRDLVGGRVRPLTLTLLFKEGLIPQVAAIYNRASASSTGRSALLPRRGGARGRRCCLRIV